MKGVFEKPRKRKGGSCKMASFRKHHEDFIRELRAPLKSREDKERQNRFFDNESRISASDIELQRELERKFDELFGSIPDTKDFSPP